MGDRLFFLNHRGSSIIEALVAFTVLSFAAMAIFPLFISSKETNKYGDSKILCQQIVRGKLDEYRHGPPLSIEGESAGTDGMPPNGDLINLTLPTVSDSSISGFGAGNTLVSGGFLYSKIRYNKYFPYSCNGVSTATVLGLPNAPQRTVQSWGTFPAPNGFNAGDNAWILGMRECIGSRIAWQDGQPVPAGGCTSAIDGRVMAELPGFKLYVKLELYSRWKLANWNNQLGDYRDYQYSDTCPNDGTWENPLNRSVAEYGSATPTNALYDFYGSNDSIKVTVTGVIDYASPEGGNKADFVGISDPSRVICSSSSLLYPSRMPIRYSLSDGRMGWISRRGKNADDATVAFPTVVQDHSVISIVAHPRNLSVYTLKSGLITRYSRCGGLNLDCINQDIVGNLGIADDASATRPAVQSWRVNDNIGAIAIDFRNEKVFGVSRDFNIYYLIQSSGGSLQDEVACGDVNNPCNATVSTVQAPEFLAGFLNQYGGSVALTGMAVTPEGDEFYLVKQIEQSGLGLNYQSGIFRLYDTNFEYPMMVLPSQVTDISL
ncbi:MAG: hypothetical protein CL678_13550 [Bdellovibrionaceae bacterium]|nr:hypothetical protein [Pseudobdellovibrionaceae bacterium]|tara:strand:- start:423 stop:2063 length:1641 start_codon:yes stop_codon:yes gene_type:complete